MDLSSSKNIVIIGGGQAGLAVSRCLMDYGIQSVIFERGRVGERWRSDKVRSTPSDPSEAIVAGVGNILRFLAISRSRVKRRGARKPFGRSVQAARIAGRYVPFGPYLALGIGIALLYWNHVVQWF